MLNLIQAGENTFYIDCPAKVGIYRHGENKIILIDSGKDCDVGKDLLKIIKANNWTLETIINTHSHADHIGGNKFLADKTGCKIYTSRTEKGFCEFPICEPAFLFGGYPNKYIRHRFLLAEQSYAGDIAKFELPVGMEIFALNGHCFGMIGVKTPDNIYFMADCVLSETTIEKHHITFVYDVAEHLATLDFIETLNGKMFIPSHAGAVDDIKPLAAANRRNVFEVIETIKDICKAPSTSEEVIKKIFDKYEIAMDMTQYVIVGSTIKSYLSYMTDNNILDVEIQNNYLLWKLV
jgi:glyoxylase-like metal-dependent hydrolase (beta-lactamase superfamily II)